jgi:hypothetical protein
VLGSRERQETKQARAVLYDGSRPAVRRKARQRLFGLVIGPTAVVVVLAFGVGNGGWLNI